MGKTFLINLNEHNRKITIGQEDDYTTACLLDFPYFKKRFKMIATDLSKQQALYADAKTIQQIIFTSNLYQEVKEPILYFSHRTVKVF